LVREKQPTNTFKKLLWNLIKGKYGISINWLTYVTSEQLDNNLGYVLYFFTVQHYFGPRGAFWHTSVRTYNVFFMDLPVISFAKGVDLVVCT